MGLLGWEGHSKVAFLAQWQAQDSGEKNVMLCIWEEESVNGGARSRVKACSTDKCSCRKLGIHAAIEVAHNGAKERVREL